MKFMRVVLCLLVCAAATGYAQAASIPATEINTYTGGTNYDFSLGWRFIPTVDIIVTHLGLIDGLNDGTEALGGYAGQQVRLFPWGGGQYLREAIIPVQAAGQGEAAGNVQAYYVPIPPITLTAGTEYMVAARVKKKDFVYSVTFLNEATKHFTRTNGQATAVNYPTMPDIATDTGTGYGNGTFPVGPTTPVSYYGGTFKYVVPEPATAGLLLAGLLAMVAWRNRRG